MATTLFNILIIVLTVNSCVTEKSRREEYSNNSKDVDTNIVDDHVNSIQRIKFRRIFEAGIQERANVTSPKSPPNELLCYVAHMKCDHSSYSEGTNRTQVCAYQKIHGLVNFQSPCEIALQNCLYRAYKEKSEKEANDPFFYNGKNKPCQYYLKIGETIEKSIMLYHIDEANIFAKYFEDFEKVDKGNKYDFIDVVYA